MSIKAIALDIDGTLTNDEKRITPRTKEALLAAARAGITLILASGRPAHGLRALAHELELDRCHGMLVAYNGSQVRDATTGELLFNQAIPVEEARAVLEHLRGFDVIPMLVDADRLYIEDAYRCTIYHKGAPKNIVKYERDACGLRIHEVHSLLDWCITPQNKILTAGTDTYLSEHQEAMAAPFVDKLSCMFTADFTSSSRLRASIRRVPSPWRCPSAASTPPSSWRSVTARTIFPCCGLRAWALRWRMQPTR